jgi:hypothetical protein
MSFFSRVNNFFSSFQSRSVPEEKKTEKTPLLQRSQTASSGSSRKSDQSGFSNAGCFSSGAGRGVWGRLFAPFSKARQDDRNSGTESPGKRSYVPVSSGYRVDNMRKMAQEKTRKPVPKPVRDLDLEQAIANSKREHEELLKLQPKTARQAKNEFEKVISQSEKEADAMKKSGQQQPAYYSHQPKSKVEEELHMKEAIRRSLSDVEKNKKEGSAYETKGRYG